MSQANPIWGAPRIVGELRKLGIAVAKSTVETYRIRPWKPSSPTWKTFLKNHVQDLVSLDFFTVPTVAHKILFVLLLLALTVLAGAHGHTNILLVGCFKRQGNLGLLPQAVNWLSHLSGQAQINQRS